MPPRLDHENLTLEISVGDLLEESLRRSIGFANRGGYERLWLGQAIHSRYQEEALEADPAYQKEVSLSVTFPHRGWQVTVSGRIDGLRRDEDGTLVVEEIKSVRRGTRLSPALRDMYERQALLYAWMLRRRGEEAVGAELVLIEIGSEAIERQPLEMSFAALEGAVKKRLNSIIRGFEAKRAAAFRRRAAAVQMAFPFPDLRPGQQEILDAVETALEQRDHLLVEAPTGLGKTVAALLPALRFALAREKRVFVLTAKTLQQEMATTVLQLLNPDAAFHSLRLRAKAKMCANDQLLCHEEYCTWAKDYTSKLSTSELIPKLLQESGTLLPDRIFDVARDAEVCPFEVSLELTGQSQVVVCDYNYAFDPYVALRDFGSDRDLGDTILIVDELHNLVSRGRGYYSPALSATAARRAAESMARGNEAIHRTATELCSTLARLIERTVEAALEDLGAQVRAAESDLPEEELSALRPDFDAAFIDYLEYRRETRSFRVEDPFVDLYFALLRFLNGLLLSEGEAFSHCVESGADGPALRILCKDPSRFLGETLNRCHSVVGLSATLSPTEFYRDLLGFDPARLSTISLPSPFPEENRRVVIDPSVATTWKRRPENYPRIAERLSRYAEQVPGNCLTLFPSYEFLNAVAGLIEVRSKRVLIQNRTDSDREREGILDTLRSALAGDVLLLAVAGGVFAEGVDYPGEMLKAVAIVGPSLPAVTLEQELLKRYYEERFERGFEYAFVVPGMTRVIQSAGRLIRSPGDRGVIALLDERFLNGLYSRYLPTHWLPAEGLEALVGDPEEVANSFFQPAAKT